MHRGYMKIYRSLADNPLWNQKPFSDGQAWVDMLIIANHKPGIIPKRGHRIKVDRGQVGHSVAALSDRWGWSRGKVSRFLDHLENEQQIIQHKTNLTTLITLVNYETYNGGGQQSEQQTDSRRTADGQQTDTNKKGEKGKNVENINMGEENPSSKSPDVKTPKAKKQRVKKDISSSRKENAASLHRPGVEIFGEFGNVGITDVERKKLTDKYGESNAKDLIERLDLYIEDMVKDKYVNHYSTLSRWANRANMQDLSKIDPAITAKKKRRAEILAREADREF